MSRNVGNREWIAVAKKKRKGNATERDASRAFEAVAEEALEDARNREIARQAVEPRRLIWDKAGRQLWSVRLADGERLSRDFFPCNKPFAFVVVTGRVNEDRTWAQLRPVFQMGEGFVDFEPDKKAALVASGEITKLLLLVASKGK